MKKDVAFVLLRGYTLRINQPHYHMTTANLINELQSIINAEDAKLWDVTSVSIRLSHEDIFDCFPEIYDLVEDMWEAVMQEDGARKTKEIAQKAIELLAK